MFLPDWLILRILHQSFEIERPKGHWSEVVVYIYIYINKKVRFHNNITLFSSVLPVSLFRSSGTIQNGGRCIVTTLPLLTLRL